MAAAQKHAHRVLTFLPLQYEIRGNSWVWGETLACDGEAALLFVEPFTLESPGEMYLRAIKIARNLRKTNKKKPYWISFNMIPLLCGMYGGGGKKGTVTRYRGGLEQKALGVRVKADPFLARARTLSRD